MGRRWHNEVTLTRRRSVKTCLRVAVVVVAAGKSSTASWLGTVVVGGDGGGNSIGQARRTFMSPTEHGVPDGSSPLVVGCDECLNFTGILAPAMARLWRGRHVKVFLVAAFTHVTRVVAGAVDGVVECGLTRRQRRRCYFAAFCGSEWFVAASSGKTGEQSTRPSCCCQRGSQAQWFAASQRERVSSSCRRLVGLEGPDASSLGD